MEPNDINKYSFGLPQLRSRIVTVNRYRPFKHTDIRIKHQTKACTGVKKQPQDPNQQRELMSP